jgi:chaperone modulatory protein CbpM
MEQNELQIISVSGQVFDDDLQINLVEFCQICQINSTEVIEMVQEGVLEPVSGISYQEWCFNSVAIHRLRTAKRLQQDLQINLPGVALALDLLQELEQLRKQLES